MNFNNQPTAARRLQSIDVLRGAVMVLMAIDHVRVYSGLPAGGAGPGIFFTRWVTHFCAPAFVFLAGTSAFFYGQKTGSRKKLSRYLLTRGLLLVLLELTLIRFAWCFNFNFSQFVLAGVIWMLGWCMILLSAMAWLKPRTVGIIGLALIFGQQLFALAAGALPLSIQKAIGPVWEFIYSSNLPGPSGISILYVIVPWIGVMMAGYGFGTILKQAPDKASRNCLYIGFVAIIIFLVWGSIVAASKQGDAPFIYRLLGQRKYPASVLYLLMTLGPIIALMPLAEKGNNIVTRWLKTIGRVPMFYYLLHIPLIHISALVVNYLRSGRFSQEWYATAPYTSVPPEQQWDLALLYFVFLADVIILTLACRWYAKYKMSHPGKRWLSYI